MKAVSPLGLSVGVIRFLGVQTSWMCTCSIVEGIQVLHEFMWLPCKNSSRNPVPIPELCTIVLLVRERVIKVRIRWNLGYVRCAAPGRLGPPYESFVCELGPMLMCNLCQDFFKVTISKCSRLSVDMGPSRQDDDMWIEKIYKLPPLPLIASPINYPDFSILHPLSNVPAQLYAYIFTLSRSTRSEEGVGFRENNLRLTSCRGHIPEGKVDFIHEDACGLLHCRISYHENRACTQFGAEVVSIPFHQSALAWNPRVPIFKAKLFADTARIIPCMHKGIHAPCICHSSRIFQPKLPRLSTVFFIIRVIACAARESTIRALRVREPCAVVVLVDAAEWKLRPLFHLLHERSPRV